MLAFYLGLPRQSEILIIIFLGICFLSLDFSLFQLRSNMEKIWQIKLENTKYLETAIKYVISTIVLVRTFTLHAFLAFYVVMLWPAIFEEKPNLMIPWLLLGIIRCLIVNGITFVVGTFICQKEKGFSPICLEYILAQIIEHGPSVYAWLSILSFYRQIAKDSVQQFSLESLGSFETSRSAIIDSQDMVNRTRSYSLSDLNMDYLCSSRVRNLKGDTSIEAVISELRDLLSKKRVIRDGSKSFDSLTQGNASTSLEQPGSSCGTHPTVLEETLETLEISEVDVLKAREEKNRFVQVLKEISAEDVIRLDSNLSAKSLVFPRAKGVKTHLPKSHSQSEDIIKKPEICLCYLRKQLQLEQSNQTLFESEIANVTFNEVERDVVSSDREECVPRKDCNTNRHRLLLNDYDYLNAYGVVVGHRFGFNPNTFLQKFVLKKNTSKNFGCQVTMLRRGFLEESRNQLAKKLVFLRHFGLP